MDSIELRNFRCFRDKQRARLAPLTLLVGENSTGKTSLMAMIRALWNLTFNNQVPDFKADPYDLGSFDDIAHHRGRRGGRAKTFEASLTYMDRGQRVNANGIHRSRACRFAVEFGRTRTEPIPVRRFLEQGDTWIEERLTEGRELDLRVATSRGSWKRSFPARFSLTDLNQYVVLPLSLFTGLYQHHIGTDVETTFIPLDNSPDITKEDLTQINQLAESTRLARIPLKDQRPYASAPVRSKPRRTYDPARTISDPEGDHIPMYLANMFFHEKRPWARLKNALEEFGQTSGLFDEIIVKQLGKRESEPFQLQVRKFGKKLKGPPRNLIDVGYGVSQILPVITELLRKDAPQVFLLQQPEVHLHPSAQAALGSIFCELAGHNRQLVIETHSDHLLDRVRMDVRDKKGRLAPKDVSILFFERTDLDVRIHSLKLDKLGNILNAPDSYRRFFLIETQRSIGF